MKYNIHPEVFSEVLVEFKRLHDKHPELDGTAKWLMAKDLVHTLQSADTAIIKVRLSI